MIAETRISYTNQYKLSGMPINPSRPTCDIKAQVLSCCSFLLFFFFFFFFPFLVQMTISVNR